MVALSMTNHNDTLYYKSGDLQGNNPERGDKLTDFRGNEWTFLEVTRPKTPGRSAKVLVQDDLGTREFYSTVFPDLEVI